MNITYPLIASSILIGAFGQLLLKVGMGQTGRVDSASQMVSPAYLLRLMTTWQIPVALALYVLGAFLWMAVLSREHLNYAYPFLGLSYVIVLFAGNRLLGEALTPGRISGTLLVALGVMLVARS